jgi:cysteine-rich repeat protein
MAVRLGAWARSWGGVLGAAAVATVGACGGGTEGGDAGVDAAPDAPSIDAPAPVDAPPDAFVPPDAWPRCSDGRAEGGEECDDGNRRADDGCSPTCTLECGDGRVSGDELCDTAIATGTGACPSSCDDGMVCTTDTLLGTGCSAECASTDITLPSDGDGCCPPDASSLTDPDCPVVCGNGLLEAGELCDTTITTGEPGACPSACDDGAVCTTDALLEGGTCTARCSATEIVAASDGDGCCPSGATVATDADCSPLCGDGVLSPSDGELCDTAIASGDGACPAACDDGMVCTADTLVGAGTCTASCTNTLLPPTNADGCCPPGANVASDDDCPIRCGDGVRSAGEACDDGNTMTGDGCSPTCTREPRAYRFSSLTIQDPRIINGSSFDVTPEVNGALRNAVTTDMFGATGTPDGVLDLSIIIRFDPLDQDAATVPAIIDFARCTAPLLGTTCTPVTPTPNTITNQSTGECIGPFPGSIPVGRVVNTPAAPCFSTAEVPEFAIGIAGAQLRFNHTQLGAQYLGDPASRLVTGLVRGFLPEADAMAIIIGGSTPLSENLRVIDRDVLDGVPGWWFYFAFVAEPVDYAYP